MSARCHATLALPLHAMPCIQQAYSRTRRKCTGDVPAASPLPAPQRSPASNRSIQDLRNVRITQP